MCFSLRSLGGAKSELSRLSARFRTPTKHWTDLGGGSLFLALRIFCTTLFRVFQQVLTTSCFSQLLQLRALLPALERTGAMDSGLGANADCTFSIPETDFVSIAVLRSKFPPRIRSLEVHRILT